MKSKNILIWATIALLCATLATSYATIYYYNQAKGYRGDYELLLRDLENLTMFANLKIDYGNGTVMWYNNKAEVMTPKS